MDVLPKSPTVELIKSILLFASNSNKQIRATNEKKNYNKKKLNDTLFLAFVFLLLFILLYIPLDV